VVEYGVVGLENAVKRLPTDDPSRKGFGETGMRTLKVRFKWSAVSEKFEKF